MRTTLKRVAGICGSGEGSSNIENYKMSFSQGRCGLTGMRRSEMGRATIDAIEFNTGAEYLPGWLKTSLKTQN